MKPRLNTLTNTLLKPIRLKAITSRINSSRINWPLRRIALAASVTVLATALGQPPAQKPFSTVTMVRSLLTGAPAQAQSASIDWSAVEREIIAEHSRIRQNPQSYIPILEAYLASMDADGNIPGGCGPNCTLVTKEGKPAVEEAISFLRSQPPVGPIEYSNVIASVAKSHAQSQRNGATGHVDAAGNRSPQRLSQAGVEYSRVGENIDYGSTDAQEVLISLLVDDGVADRGHRINLFDPDWTTAGAGCGPHAAIRTVCVVNYARISRQLKVINNGTLDLLSLKVADADVLGGALSAGDSRELTVAEGESCTVDLTVEIAGGYSPLLWRDLLLCGGTMTIEPDNTLSLTY